MTPHTHDTLARTTDPVTSHNAAATARRFRSTLQREVYDVFVEFGEMTDATLAGLFSDKKTADGKPYAESTVRKRRSELTADGLIVNSGLTDGRHAIWKLV
jgi:hypothetical protein